MHYSNYSSVFIFLTGCLILTATADIFDSNFPMDFTYKVTSVLVKTMDPLFIVRISSTLAAGWFDSLAPYQTNSTGMFTKLLRVPTKKVSLRNKNIATAYASRRLSEFFFSNDKAAMLLVNNYFNSVFNGTGMSPSNLTEGDLTDPICIGNTVGKAIIAVRKVDGSNQLGTLSNSGPRGSYNALPYADYSGYKPVNSDMELIDPSRWQPLTNHDGKGKFSTQKAMAPHLDRTIAMTGPEVNKMLLPTPPPRNYSVSSGVFRNATIWEVNFILNASATLTDKKKGMIEFFDDKVKCFVLSVITIAQDRALRLDDYVALEFVLKMATFDAAIAAWHNKYIYDSVRPISLVRYFYGEDNITAWGGLGRGTVSDIKGKEWSPYIGTPPHPDYPAGTACFCAATAQAARLFFASDALGYRYNWTQGASVIEPGLTPASPRGVILSWDTWTKFSDSCSKSRVDGGVHFRFAVTGGSQLCKPIGDRAYGTYLKLSGKK